MAEIKIEKKKPVWPWILLAIILLAIILFFVFAEDADDMEYDNEKDTEQVSESRYNSDGSIKTGNNGSDYEGKNNDVRNGNDRETISFATAMDNYENYIADSNMGLDHEYSHGALDHLIKAVEAKANAINIDISADLDEARENAKIITKDPEKVIHADLIKASGKIIVKALYKLQSERYPELKDEVADVKEDVNEIDKSVHALNQKGSVNAFFESAEDVLNNMN